MPTNDPLTPELLAAKKAAILKQQAADNQAATESDAALHRLADEIHNRAFADGSPQAFDASLQAAATELIAAGRKTPDFPPAALANLLRYAPDAVAATGQPTLADPIAAAAATAEAEHTPHEENV